MNDDQSSLLAVVDHLAAAGPDLQAWTWQSWQLRRIKQGMNNRLFHIQRQEQAYAVKFTIPDRRDRAGREWQALQRLKATDLPIAPLPVLLVRRRYAQAVVVQTWLAGMVSEQPPASDGEWQSMLDHMLAVHALRPDQISQQLLGDVRGRAILRRIHTLSWNRLFPGLRPVVLYITSAADALAQIRWQMAQMPEAEQPPGLQGLVKRANRVTFPTWRPPRHTLCRADPHICNFIRRSGAWASVDWEYSGWGDPAFDIADLLTHVAHLEVGDERWQWFVERYCARSPDAGCGERIAAYRTLMLVWWCARLARYIYETARGLDQRLAEPAADWATTKQQQIQTYLERADVALASWGE